MCLWIFEVLFEAHRNTGIFVAYFTKDCRVLTTSQPLWIICVVSQRKGEAIEEIVEEMKQGRKRNRNESEESEKNRNIPSSTLTHTRNFSSASQIRVGSMFHETNSKRILNNIM